jgi:hypothetical protein
MLYEYREKIMKIVKDNIIDKLKSDAAKELQEEFEERAKNKIKQKLRDLELARRVVKNLKRELDDLYVELSE